MGGSVSFTPGELIFDLPVEEPVDAAFDPAQAPNPQHRDHNRDAPLAFSRIRLRFVDANGAAEITGTTRLPGIANYLVSDDRADWRTNLPTYAGIVYHQLYPGVDLQYTGTDGHLKSTYIIAPHTDPDRLRWRYDGATDVRVDEAGNLHITLPTPVVTDTATITPAVLIEQAPLAWQVSDGGRLPVSARYAIAADGSIGFTLGAYDATQPLTIDPTLLYSAYITGPGADVATGVAVDNEGNAYVTGRTASSGSGDDVFVTELNADGSARVFTTYLGGSDTDQSSDIALDRHGNIFITGWTSSANFPVNSGVTKKYGFDVFVAQLAPSGDTIDYSLFIGGSDWDYAAAIAVDDMSQAYITGWTESTDFPIVEPLQRYHHGDLGGGNYDAFVAKLAADGAPIYSTFLGGVWHDEGTDIAVDRYQNAYVVGTTLSADLFAPATPLRRKSGGYDVFVAKISISGHTLIYGTFLGGGYEDRGNGIAVDTDGNAYIVGTTGSPNFPTAGAARGYRGGWDAFVTKLSSDGSSVLYCSYLGGSNDDYGNEVAMGPDGHVYITGITSSADFGPVNAAQTMLQGATDAFVSRIDTSATGAVSLIYNTYLGSIGSDYAYSIAVDASGNAYVVGRTTAGDPNGDGFVAKLGEPGQSLPADQSAVPEDCNCASPAPQPHTENPVNTRSGTFWTAVTDLSVQTPGPELVWKRTYASQSTDTISAPLGFGWQVPFTARLITPTMPGGESGRVIVISPVGNTLRYADLGNGQYRALPGIYSTLTRSEGTFIQTLRDQRQFLFDAASGHLAAMHGGHGRTLNLIYSGASPRLSRIVDAADDTRFLALTYTADGHIGSVSDGMRTVIYTYDIDGDLTGVLDVMGRQTSYAYQGHLLTRITDALGRDVERMAYDTYTAAGKVISQILQDGQQLQFDYQPKATTITTMGRDGQQTVETIGYGADNTMTGIRINGQPVVSASFDGSFSPKTVVDGNGNTTQTRSTDNGLPLATTNALNQTTRTIYDTQNRPISITDALGFTTLYQYDARNNLISVTSGVTTTSAIRATTLYTYSYDVRSVGDSLLQEQRTSDGVVTRYEHNAGGQVAATIVGYGTPLAQKTTYAYDTLGRLETTTYGADTPLARSDLTRYNADNTIAATIQNYKDGVFDPAHPDEDLITTSGYDRLGRQVWLRDALGQYDATHYDVSGRVDWTAHNLVPLQLDDQGQPIYQPYTTAQPDANVAMLYRYDGLGRTALVTETGILSGAFDPATLRFSDTTTRVTRTEYDQLSRPVTVTLNYRPDLPIGMLPDVNIQMLTYYDGAGNVIWQRDALGRWTRTDYDALKRPIRVITNYEDGNPLTGANDTDVVSETRYDGAGRITQQRENVVDGTFTATEPITDRITLSQYDPVTWQVMTIQAYDLSTLGNRSDTNRTSITAYAPGSSRILGQRDPLGRWVHQQYDALGRLSASVLNCRDGQGTPTPQGCAAFDPAQPDRNAPTQTRYDALGRAFETIDALGHVTHMEYDGVGRAIAIIQNYVANSPATSSVNVTTRTTLDALGRVLASTDALGATTQYTMNGLGQPVQIADPINRVTRIGYDGHGARRWIERPDGRITVYRLDGLGRLVTTIQNYQDGTATPADPTDQDLITRTVYDVAGRRVQTIDPAGRISAFGYDNLNRLISVTENAANDICMQPPCNVVTRYQYDRAGNLTAIIDARGYVRRFTYDAANHEVATTDALDRTTQWDYDALGRVTRQISPGGEASTLTLTYDDRNRLTQVAAPNLGQITAHYDALGRRLSLTDGTGTTSFAYDPQGRMVQVNAPQTGTVGYDYNPRGQRTQLTYPGGAEVRYDYWPDGRLHTMTQGSTELASYTYDSVGRPQDVTQSNRTQITYRYDGVDRLRDLTMTANGEVRERFSYQLDRAGQRTVVTDTLALSEPGMSSGACGLMPIAVSARTLEGHAVGDTVDITNEGSQPGNKGWLSWTGSTGETTLVASLSMPGDSQTYVNPNDPQDHIVSTGDWVRGRPGVTNSRGVRDALDKLKTTDIVVPVWDTASGSGNTSMYRVAAFARVRLVAYDLSKKRMTIRLLGYVTCGSFPTETRVTSYAYDGLRRLTGAADSTGTTSAYSYDLVGNRTDAWVNGAPVEHHDYDAANQVVGWQYDAAGNLLSDGTASYTYDALNRTLSISGNKEQRAYRYNGDGTLIAQTADGVETHYTQDLAAPLSQVLQTTQNGQTVSELYGLNRLAAMNGNTRIWYGSDGLGSVRLTLDDLGAPLTTHWYDPWGTTQGSASSAPFGFTGELQDSATGLVYLRDRWYHAGHGTLTSQDPLAGDVNQPYSLHPYQYAYSNPLLFSDPSGRTAGVVLPWLLNAGVAGAAAGSTEAAASTAVAGGAVTLGVSTCVATVVCAMAVGMTIGFLAIGIGVTAFSQDVPDRPWSTGGPAPNLEPFELPPTSVQEVQKGSNYLGGPIAQPEACVVLEGPTPVDPDLQWPVFWPGPLLAPPMGPLVFLAEATSSDVAASVGIQNAADFRRLQNASIDQILDRVPPGWSRGTWEPYYLDPGWQGVTPELAGREVKQWKFTSPDGRQEIRLKQIDPRFGGIDSPKMQIRWGIQVEPDNPYYGISFQNPKGTDSWVYFDDAGIATNIPARIHTEIGVTVDDMIRIFGTIP